MSTDDTQIDDGGSTSYMELVDELQNVDTSSPEASQNETSISDNNGGRIELGEDGSSDYIIRK